MLSAEGLITMERVTLDGRRSRPMQAVIHFDAKRSWKLIWR